MHGLLARAAARLLAKRGIQLTGQVIKNVLKTESVKLARVAGKQGAKKAATVAERYSLRAENAFANWAVRSKPTLIRNPVTGNKEMWLGGKPNLATRTAMRGTWRALHPNSKLSAVTSGFIQGTLRTSSSMSVNVLVDVMLGVPKYITRAPQYSAFIRSGASAYRTARTSNIAVNRFSAIYKAYNTATEESKIASRVYTELLKKGTASPEALKRITSLQRYEKGGYIAGRLGTGSAGYYALTDKETREKRINKLKSTFGADVQKEARKAVSGRNRKRTSSSGRTWVDPHTRNGHAVKGHWRSF